MPGGDVVQAIMVITCLGERARDFMGHFITASDKQYINWMAKDKTHSNPGLYRQYAVKGDERDAKKTVVIYRARVVSRADEPVLLSPIMYGSAMSLQPSHPLWNLKHGFKQTKARGPRTRATGPSSLQVAPACPTVGWRWTSGI